MRAGTGQQRVIWHPHVAASYSTLIPVSDPQVPAGLPVSVDVVRVKTNRDSARKPDQFFPVVAGQLITASAWACHDPACPASTHAYMQVIFHWQSPAGGQGWNTIVQLAPTPGGWRLLQGGREINPLAYRARSFLTINQDAQTGQCRWLVAGESSTLIP
jgi:hypothetical protein